MISMISRVGPVVFAAGAMLAPATAESPAAAAGGGLYQQRCAMCHASGVGGAPLLDKLALLEPQDIVTKTTEGTMAPMSAGLTEEDKRNIAVFLTKKPLPASGALPAVAP